MNGQVFDNTALKAYLQSYYADESRCVSEAVLCAAVCVSEGMKALWDDYASGSKQRKHLLESRYGRKALLSTMEDFLSEGWIAINSKNCPDCFCRIQVFTYSRLSTHWHT